MNYYEALANSAPDVSIVPSETSYFSVPNKEVDPKLFRNGTLVPNVRSSIIAYLYNHLALGYAEAPSWTKIYLAGSGVSYQWNANRHPADLDCLISVDYIKFRQANQEYKGWSDKEIAAEINQGFKNELHPRTEDFLGSFEMTFYVNANPNIEEIKPYAAYSVLDDVWVIPPVEQEAPSNPGWETAVARDVSMATEIVKRYEDATKRLQAAASEALRVNAESALAVAISQGASLFEDIHSTRGEAFGPSGQGYADFNNYRWQSGKRSGIVQSLKKLHHLKKDSEERYARQTYGVELPTTDTLLRRAYRPR